MTSAIAQDHFKKGGGLTMNKNSTKHNPLDPPINPMYGILANKLIASHMRFKSCAFSPYSLKLIFLTESGSREARNAISSIRNSVGIFYLRTPTMKIKTPRTTKTRTNTHNPALDPQHEKQKEQIEISTTSRRRLEMTALILTGLENRISQTISGIRLIACAMEGSLIAKDEGIDSPLNDITMKWAMLNGIKAHTDHADHILETFMYTIYNMKQELKGEV